MSAPPSRSVILQANQMTNLKSKLLSMVLGCICATAPISLRAESPTHTYVGKKVQPFTLDNCYGKPVSLDDLNDKKIVVITYLGTECPLAKLYSRRLSQLQTRYAEDGVAFLGVNSNTQDSLTELAAFTRRYEVNFPMLKDPGNRVADAMNAKRTPEVFVLDQERIVRYHGRIDDQYGVGYSKDKTVHSDLNAAIEDLLADRPVKVAETKPVGCHIGRLQKVEPTGEITYTKHIAPIFNARCVSCHREQEVAPFTLTSYQDIQGWEETILEVIADNRMPPWSANPDHGKFSNDARLSNEEKRLIETWVDNGMPEGNKADLPEPPTFTLGWRIPKPDQVIKMRNRPFKVPAEGIVDYKRFVIDPGWNEDKYVYAAEARPDNRSVVHHILVYVIPPGADRADLRRTLVGYAPGSLPVHLKDGVAMHVPGGSKLLFEMHYTPNGYEQTDQSYAGFCFMDKADVKKELKGQIAANHRLQIPPGDANYSISADYVSRRDEMLIDMTPHMHLRGKAFRYVAFFPDGREEVLLDVPNYDFNWQLKYILDQPKRLPRGTRIKCSAVYDNSENNLSNPDPSKTVYWGDQSWDEMMIGFMSTIDADRETPKRKLGKRGKDNIDPTGTWSWSRDEKGKTWKERVTFAMKDGVLTGSIRIKDADYPISNAVIDGDKLTFKVAAKDFGGTLLTFNAKFKQQDGFQTITGEVHGANEKRRRTFDLPWTATQR